MINQELLPLPVYRIAFVYILLNNLRVATPTCMINYELLPLPVSKIAIVNILLNNLGYFPYLYGKLRVASPTCF